MPCLAGVIHEEKFGKNYHFSWLAVGKDTKWDWEGARNYCRRFCMDSIAIGSKEENAWVKGLLKQGNVPYIWTGGHSFWGCYSKKKTVFLHHLTISAFVFQKI
jgi:hypothetical protein